MDSKKNEFFINLEVWRMLWNYLGYIWKFIKQQL